MNWIILTYKYFLEEKLEWQNFNDWFTKNWSNLLIFSPVKNLCRMVHTYCKHKLQKFSTCPHWLISHLYKNIKMAQYIAITTTTSYHVEEWFAWELYAWRKCNSKQHSVFYLAKHECSCINCQVMFLLTRFVRSSCDHIESHYI